MAAIAAVAAVVLACFVGTQIYGDAWFVAHAAGGLDETRCCAPPFTRGEVLSALAVAVTGIPAVGALAYLAGRLIKSAAAGFAAAAGRPQHTYIAAAVVAGWVLVFAAFGWRP